MFPYIESPRAMEWRIRDAARPWRSGLVVVGARPPAAQPARPRDSAAVRAPGGPQGGADEIDEPLRRRLAVDRRYLDTAVLRADARADLRHAPRRVEFARVLDDVTRRNEPEGHLSAVH